MTDLHDVTPDATRSQLVVAAPGVGPHYWAGAPSACLDGEGGYVLAYRTRNGYDGVDANVVARSANGVDFETVLTLPRDRFGARWVERPSIVRTTGGRWRLYVCCAAQEGANWWVEALESDTLEGLATAESRPVFSGGEAYAVKDPVIRCVDGRWEGWLCCHLLDEPGQEDRMLTSYVTSADGWDWDWHGPVLQGRDGEWDARGVRVTGLLLDGRAYFDGRATQDENWFERSSLAAPVDRGPVLRAVDGAPVVDLRYVEPLALPDGGVRLYYEHRLADESHELRTELLGG